jgi:hypothetical protein
MEGIEPNPGPVSWVELANQIRAEYGDDDFNGVLGPALNELKQAIISETGKAIVYGEDAIEYLRNNPNFHEDIDFPAIIVEAVEFLGNCL